MKMEFTETSVSAPNLPTMENGKEGALLNSVAAILSYTGVMDEIAQNYCERILDENGVAIDILGELGELRIGTYECSEDGNWKYLGSSTTSSPEHVVQQSPIIS